MFDQLASINRLSKRLPSVSTSFILFLLLGTVALCSISTAHAAVDFDEGYDTELVTARTALSVSQAEPGNSYTAALIIDISSGWHINTDSPYQDWLIPAEIQFDPVDGITVSSLSYPKGHDVFLGEEKMSVFSKKTIVFFDLSVDGSLAPGDYSLPLHFTYQPCDDRECRAPQTIDLTLPIKVGPEGSLINEAIFNQSVLPDDIPAADQSSAEEYVEENELQRLIDEKGVWGYFIALGLAFLTGLLLSFSPCTYPMIPITVSIFGGQDRTVGQGFIMSLVYVGSMATVYGVMGLVVSLVGGVFGAWLASPLVVIGIAVVFVIFSLSMFGLYELSPPMWLRQKLGTKGKGGGGVAGVIVLGIIAALVVSPCVGPFVAGILLYVATSGSPTLGFLILFVFALGLGTLYVIIGTFSSAITKFPGAGEWMETVKKFFGFVLLLMALYFLRTIISVDLLAILTGLLLLAFGVFGGGLDRLTPESSSFMRLKKFIGLLTLLAGIYLLAGALLSQGFIYPPANDWLPSGGASGVENKSPHIDWVTDLKAGLAKAKSENKPVLIDTWATWCVNCRVLDKTTFQDPNVVKLSGQFVGIKVQLEKAGSKVTRDFMKRFGMKQYTLPTVLLLDANGKTRKILRGVFDPDQLIDEMRKLL